MSSRATRPTVDSSCRTRTLDWRWLERKDVLVVEAKRREKWAGNGGAVPVEKLGLARLRDPFLGRKRQDLVDDMSHVRPNEGG